MKKNIHVSDYKKRNASILLETLIALAIIGFLSFYINNFNFNNKKKLLETEKKENLYFLYYLVIDNIENSKKKEINEKQLSEYINYDIIKHEKSITFDSLIFTYKTARLKTIYLYDTFPMSVYIDTFKVGKEKIKIERYRTLK